MEYGIYILTRFNLKCSFGENYKKTTGKDPEVDFEYLTERFRLFETYTLPSIAAQTDKNFKWYVFFSTRTPDFFKDQINTYQHQYDFFVSVYIDGLDANLISDILKSECKDIYITMRLDNDDAVRKDIIQDIRNYIEFKNNFDTQEILYYDYGLQYNEATRIVSHYHFVNNHFLVKICKNNAVIDTTLSYDHTHALKDNISVNLGKGRNNPMWLEVIHGSNAANISQLGAYNAYYYKNPFMNNAFGVDIPRNTNVIYIFFKTLFIPLKRIFIILKDVGFRNVMLQLWEKLSIER